MGRFGQILTRMLSGIRQLVRWYLGPIGLLFGLALVGAIVALSLGSPTTAVAVLIAGIATVIPWKFVRQRNEFRTIADVSRAEHDRHAQDLARVREDLALTATFDDVEATLRGFRRAHRKTIKNLRERVAGVQAGQGRQADLIQGEVSRLETQLNSIEATTRDIASANQSRFAVQADLENLARQVTELSTLLDELRRGHAQVLIDFEEEQRAIVSDGTAQHYFVAPGYRRRSVLVANFDDTDNEDQYQREVYDYALGVALQSDSKRILDFGCGSAFKFMSRFSNFETVGIDVPETVSFLREEYPDRTWIETGELTPEMFDDFDLVISSDVIEHLIEPDLLLDALARSNAGNIILSTPARELLIRRGDKPLGPPTNPHHFLEWTTEEFRTFVGEYLDVVMQRISNETQATQLLHARRY